MKIYEISDPEFKSYGRVVDGYDMTAIDKALRDETPLPDGTDYVPNDEAISSLPETEAIGTMMYGGLPVQWGWCNGHNTKLNCLEYHRDSEFNYGTEEFVLLLAKMDELTDYKLDTSVVKAFRVPAGVLVEVYATTLHYAPCHTDAAKGFKVLVALPKGTNTDKPQIPVANVEDTLLRAANKWLIAHADSSEAKDGAFVGLEGENIDIAK